MNQPLLEFRDLSVSFKTETSLVKPVNKLNLSIYPGQTVALVGESGCGKSVSAMSVLRLIPSPPAIYTDSQILLDGANLLQFPMSEMRKVRGGKIAMIFQEPMTSLNPVFTIGDQIAEAVVLHQHVGMREAYNIALKALNDVGVADPARRLHDYPHQMSGGNAPARHDRHGAGVQTPAADRRRTDHGAGCHHPGADIGSAEQAAA